jgi:hypothetical protein
MRRRSPLVWRNTEPRTRKTKVRCALRYATLGRWSQGSFCRSGTSSKLRPRLAVPYLHEHIFQTTSIPSVLCVQVERDVELLVGLVCHPQPTDCKVRYGWLRLFNLTILSLQNNLPWYDSQ